MGKKHLINWNIHNANDIKSNPIHFLYCFLGRSTRDSLITVYKVNFQEENMEETSNIDNINAKYYILSFLHYKKKSEDYDPYGKDWYKNYVDIEQISEDYYSPMVFTSLKELEKYLLNKTDEDFKIIDIKPHKKIYDGSKKYKDTDNIFDIEQYFKEFRNGINIFDTKIERHKITFYLGLGFMASLELKNGKGYLNYWNERYENYEKTILVTERAIEAVQWLLKKRKQDLYLK